MNGGNSHLCIISVWLWRKQDSRGLIYRPLNTQLLESFVLVMLAVCGGGFFCLSIFLFHLETGS